VSSEGSEKYATSDVTDTFEIGFLDEKKVIYKCAQFYEERKAGAYVQVPVHF
jgi:hypothetical protein